MNKKVMLLAFLVILAALPVVAQETATATTTTTAGTGVRWGFISASFLLGIAAAAGAIGQARAIAAAVEGIARNPSAAGPIRLAMIIGLALIESLVIYALIIAYLLQQKG